jgi:hypothetical protein
MVGGFLTIRLIAQGGDDGDTRTIQALTLELERGFQLLKTISFFLILPSKARNPL